MYKLPQMAAETKPVPLKFRNVRSKFKRNEPKAKRVSFFKNGDYYDYGLHVPIQGHKHFQSLAHLCDFLTSKTRLPQGVRYIFTQDGKLVNELEDFEDGNIYVVSSSKHFESLSYGAVARVKTSHVIKAVNLTDDDVKYLRPASPLKSRKEYRKPLGAKPNPFQNTSKDTRVFTVINNRFHDSKSSILFNINTGQSFEGALEDWGQSVGVKKVRRMTTRFGREVRSLSQLKHDFRDVDVFYLEGEDAYNDVGSKLSKKYDYDTGYPSKGPVVEWIHGYSGSTPSPNMHLVSTGELLYPVGTVIVLYDQREDRQRHYSKHTEDVQSVCVHPSLKAVASGQASGNENTSQAVVHVWNIETLEPIIIVGKNQLDGNIITVDFSPNDFMLLTIESGREEAVTLWDWESDAIVGRSSTAGDNITGGAFHPYEDNLMMTFGMHHLAFWKRGKDGFLARRNALAPGHSGRTISSWTFFPDGGFVVGDSSGFITIWNKSNEEQFYIEKEIRAHDRDVNSLLLLPGGTLLSGGRSNDDSHLRAWDTEDGFNHIASAKISDFGGVKSMCPQKLSAEDGNLFIGTKYNTILEGSVHRKFKIIVQGHRKEVIDLSVNSEELAFVTVDRDHYIYKWSLRTLYWNEKLEIDSISVAMYPGGGVIITGGKNGKFMALNSENGLIVSTITVAFTSLTVLSYSADGRMLAVGCQDGSIYIYQTQSKGYQYKKISVLRNGNPLLNIDWSFNLSAIQAVSSDNEFYELTLWNVKEEKRLNPDTAENIDWNEHTCTVGHNIIGIWKIVPRPKVVYLSCNKSKSGKLLVGGDKDGFIRVFRYPCKSSENAKYFERKQSTGAITSVRFFNDNYLASAGNSDGSIFIWKLVKQQ